MSTEEPAMPQADEYRVEHVRDALAHDSATTELDVRVTLAGGRILLSGFAATEAHRQAISEVARRVAPDLEVVNQMDLAEFGDAGEAESLW
jgi:osmotically-inducible protein OsmY